MYNVTYNNISQLSDALEREMIRGELSRNSAVSIGALLTRVAAHIKKSFCVVLDYTVEVAKARNEARAQSVRLTGADW